jgi:hypothetical protein
MSPIRLVSAFALLVVASTAAQAGSPAAAAAAAPASAGVESRLPKLDLGLSEVDYALADGWARTPVRASSPEAQAASRTASLAQLLKAPAPYGQLLPQPIDDRGVGYRVWF